MAAEAETQPASTQQDTSVGHCLRCGLECSVLEGAIPKGNSFCCKDCNNLYQIIYRHLGGLPETYYKMTPEKQKEFYKESKAQVKFVGKNARWSLVRNSLVKSLVTFRTEQTRVRVSEEWLPLSVWEKRGFSTDDIQKRGKSRDDPVARHIFFFILFYFPIFYFAFCQVIPTDWGFCFVPWQVFQTVWTAPLTSVNVDDISGTVEKEICELEHKLKAKTSAKGKRPATEASGSTEKPSVVEVDDDVWSIPSEDDRPVRQGAAAKAPKSSKKDDAAVAARKEAKAREQKWKKEVAKATRVINSLNSICQSFAVALGKAVKISDDVPDSLMKGLKEADEKTRKLKSGAVYREGSQAYSWFML